MNERWMYETMVRIRIFEERVADLVEAKEIRTPTHLCIGQEACAVGVVGALRPDDYIVGAHRSHGHYIAKTGDLRKIMAEIFCRAGGCSGGRGGSMHLIAPEHNVMGTVPIVGATIPIGVGLALAARYRGEDRVAVSFFGDGAVEEGVFHEALNFASLKKLPVVFAIENNLFSSHLPLRERQPADNIVERAAGYSIPGVRVDGNDAAAVREAAGKAVERARAGGGPTLLELRTYRWRGHVGPSFDLEVGIREKAELDAWVARCPIRRMEERLGLDRMEIESIRARAERDVDEAVAFARSSPRPEPTTLGDHVFRP